VYRPLDCNRTAQTWLHEDGAALGELAFRLGYRSEAAFSRAFKRFVGVPPGVVRRHADPANDLAPDGVASHTTYDPG